MVLDVSSLKVTLGVVALTLSVLFYGSYRRTGSSYSGWWCLALGLLMAGNVAYLLTGTSQQVWADPLGNALLVAGPFGVWAGSRSLRLLTQAERKKSAEMCNCQPGLAVTLAHGILLR